MIGNPLYVPAEKEGSITLEERSASAGLWVAHRWGNETAYTKDRGSNGQIRRTKLSTDFIVGSLFIYHTQISLWIPKLPFTKVRRYNRGILFPTTLEELLDKEYIVKMNYKIFFSDLEEYHVAVKEIPEKDDLFYTVTKKGHNKVIVRQRPSGQMRKQPLPNAVPVPVINR